MLRLSQVEMQDEGGRSSKPYSRCSPGYRWWQSLLHPVVERLVLVLVLDYLLIPLDIPKENRERREEWRHCRRKEAS